MATRPIHIPFTRLGSFWVAIEGDEPPHVHVERDETHAAKFWLNPVRLAGNWGLGSADERRDTLTIMEHEQEFVAAYNAHLGR